MINVFRVVFVFTFLFYGFEALASSEPGCQEIINNAADPTVGGLYGNIIRWLVLSIILVMTVGVFGFYLKSLWFGPPKWLTEVSAYDRSVTFAAPFQTFFAILCSLFIVLLLRFSTGPIEFKVLGFQFSGASGPIVLWVLCFLSIIFGLYYMGPRSFKGLQ